MYWQAETVPATNPVNWTAAGVIVALLVGAGGVIIASLTLRGVNRKSTQDDAEWKGKVNTLLSGIRKDLDELRKIVFAKFSVPLVVPQSPFRLTKLGKTVSQEIGAAAWVERVAESLAGQTKGRDAYEIQTICFDHAEDLDQYLDKELRVIRQTAFQRGLKTREVRPCSRHRTSRRVAEKGWPRGSRSA